MDFGVALIPLHCLFVLISNSMYEKIRDISYEIDCLACELLNKNERMKTSFCVSLNVEFD